MIVVHQSSMMQTVERTTIYRVPHVMTSYTETTAHGLEIVSIVKSVLTTMSMSATTVESSTGTATDTTVQKTRTTVLSIVTRTDLAHTSLAKVSIISALS